MSTLNDILKEHPEWGDLPVAVLNRAGEREYLDGSLSVFPSDKYGVDEGDDECKALIFCPN